MSCSIVFRIFLLVVARAALGCTSSNGSAGPPVPDDALPTLSAVPGGSEVGRIVDPSGREVLLRGVNVNAHIEYWQYDPNLFTTYPFTEDDADMVAAMGWNMVRLGLSWLRVEPEPGVYDGTYLDELAEAVAMLRERGVYTLMDLHQDPWSPHIAAPPDQECPEGAWKNVLDDVEGPGGVGIRSRYARMFGHLVARFANDDSVVGYEVINEPAVFVPGQETQLTEFYEDCSDEMRAPERAKDPQDDYFERHLVEQDRYLFGGAIWIWREACGDAHKYNEVRDGRVPYVWGFFGGAWSIDLTR